MIGEEKKKLPTKIDLNTEQGLEVVSEVVYKDEVSRYAHSLAGAYPQRRLTLPRPFDIFRSGYCRRNQARADEEVLSGWTIRLREGSQGGKDLFH